MAPRRPVKKDLSGPGVKALRKFVAEFEKFPASLRKEMRPLLTEVAAESLSRAKANASWSRRIPGAIRARVTFSKTRGGVSLTVNRRKAPHARPMENLGQQGTFEHPTPTGGTVKQEARPFFFQSMDTDPKTADRKIGEIVDRVSRSYKFR